jgi:hypothetical protein
MIGTLISIIFTVIILGILWWGAQQLLPLIPMGEPFRTIVRVLMMVVIALVALWIVWQLLVASGVVSGRPFRFGGEPGGAAAALSAAPARHLPWLLVHA